MALKININTGAWNRDEEMVLSFPDGWNVSAYESKDISPLDESGINAAFAVPIGAKPIEQIARDRKNAVIIVDDLSRPTPAHKVIPIILEELKRGGMADDAISFVIGGGSHRPLTREEMASKVGDAVVAKYPIRNHNAFSKTLANLGHLEDGTPVHIDEIVMQADLKIAISGIIPHSSVGFGGGGKIILPGVAGYETISYNHSKFRGRGRGNLERQGQEKDVRDNVEDVARRVGLDFSVNMVLTKKRGIGGLFAGDFVESYCQGAIFARKVYETPIPKEKLEWADIVVINAYPQDYDPVQDSKSMWPVSVFRNAQKIVINPATDGIAYHGLADKMDYDTFLKNREEEQEKSDFPKEGRISSKENFVLLSSNFPKRKFYRQYPDGGLFDSWDEMIDQLRRLYNKANVAVIPYSPIQLPHFI